MQRLMDTAEPRSVRHPDPAVAARSVQRRSLVAIPRAPPRNTSFKNEATTVGFPACSRRYARMMREIRGRHDVKWVADIR